MKKDKIKKIMTTALCVMAALSAVPAIPAYAAPRHSASYGRTARSNDSFRNVAEKVQKAFDSQNFEVLSNLCNYPLPISYSDGTYAEIQNREDFLALGKDTVFTQMMMDAIAATNVAKLEDGDHAGVQMGGDYGLSLYKINGTWKVNSFYLDAAEAGGFNFTSAADAALSIQKSFSYRDLDGISQLCNFPLILTAANGTMKEVGSPAELLALGESKIFTDRLLTAIDSTDLTQLQEIGNHGILMGGDAAGLNMYQFNGYWKINQIYQ